MQESCSGIIGSSLVRGAFGKSIERGGGLNFAVSPVSNCPRRRSTVQAKMQCQSPGAEGSIVDAYAVSSPHPLSPVIIPPASCVSDSARNECGSGLVAKASSSLACSTMSRGLV